MTKKSHYDILFIGLFRIKSVGFTYNFHKEMITINKKILSVFMAILSAVLPTVSACASGDYSWAKTEIEYCQKNHIMEGDENGELNPGGTLTRAQMAKMLVEGFDLEYDESAEFSDIDENDWYYDYAKAIKHCMTEPDEKFNGDEAVSREEFASTLVLASGLKASYLCNYQILDDNFKDADKVSKKYKKLLSVAVERAYYRGSDYYLRPKDLLKRAEVCAMLYRVLELKNGYLKLTRLDLGVPESNTPLLGESAVTKDAAIRWAKAHNAADLFIDAAEYYWKYGEITGIRPDVLYAQASKETGFGRYGGRVLPEMNNFAGIKKYGATDDRTEDHESFATRDDGVRAHFNHMCAYVGLEPVGEVHGRYKSVLSLSWAGTVKYVEDLGGRWCPDLYYGYAIVKNLLEDMKKYE